MTDATACHALAQRTLGPITIDPKANLPANIMAFVDSRGRRHLAKRHTSRDRYARELYAYTHWVPAIQYWAPHLITADPDHLILLLTEVPGVPASLVALGDDAEQAVYRAAGSVLRRLHDSAPPEYSHQMAVTLAERTSLWVGRAGALLNAGERRLLLEHADAIAAEPVEIRFCHLDFQPRNWVIDDQGTVRLIDFEHARLDARIRDIARMAHRYWPQRPDLYHAFIQGYGVLLNEHDRLLLYHFGALEVATALVRGHETDDTELTMQGRALLGWLARHPAPPADLWSNP
jgi:hypothetical protein